MCISWSNKKCFDTVDARCKHDTVDTIDGRCKYDTVDTIDARCKHDTVDTIDAQCKHEERLYKFNENILNTDWNNLKNVRISEHNIKVPCLVHHCTQGMCKCLDFVGIKL
jgi:hypothetical protein